jgi:8-oxo-dGTP pyrophosphatase MutT (NUDIX family)
VTGTVPLDIRPGVAGIVRDELGRVLLHRRVVGDGWAPPSGSVEPGERVTDAIIREVMEETALTIRVARLVGIYSDPDYQIVDYPDGRSVHFVTCLFECQAVGGDLRGSEEGTAWQWFDPRSLPDELLPYGLVWVRDAQDADRKLKIR